MTWLIADAGAQGRCARAGRPRDRACVFVQRALLARRRQHLADVIDDPRLLRRVARPAPASSRSPAPTPSRPRARWGSVVAPSKSALLNRPLAALVSPPAARLSRDLSRPTLRTRDAPTIRDRGGLAHRAVRRRAPALSPHGPALDRARRVAARATGPLVENCWGMSLRGLRRPTNRSTRAALRPGLGRWSSSACAGTDPDSPRSPAFGSTGP